MRSARLGRGLQHRLRTTNIGARTTEYRAHQADRAGTSRMGAQGSNIGSASGLKKQTERPKSEPWAAHLRAIFGLIDNRAHSLRNDALPTTPRGSVHCTDDATPTACPGHCRTRIAGSARPTSQFFCPKSAIPLQAEGRGFAVSGCASGHARCAGSRSRMGARAKGEAGGTPSLEFWSANGQFEERRWREPKSLRPMHVGRPRTFYLTGIGLPPTHAHTRPPCKHRRPATPRATRAAAPELRAARGPPQRKQRTAAFATRAVHHNARRAPSLALRETAPRTRAQAGRAAATCSRPWAPPAIRARPRHARANDVPAMCLATAPCVRARAMRAPAMCPRCTELAAPCAESQGHVGVKLARPVMPGEMRHRRHDDIGCLRTEWVRAPRY